jgi:hypothetical protein
MADDEFAEIVFDLWWDGHQWAVACRCGASWIGDTVQQVTMILDVHECEGL